MKGFNGGVFGGGGRFVERDSKKKGFGLGGIRRRILRVLIFRNGFCVC